MPTLYVTEQGAKVVKEDNRLVVKRDDIVLTRIHDFKVERIVVFGNVQLTTQVMAFLLERGIDTAFLSQRGKLKGRLAPLASRNAPLRIHQYERTRDPIFAAAMAGAFVHAKATNCAEVLARHHRNHPECDFRAEIRQLIDLAGRAGRTQTVDALRGVEGQAAAVYFEGFARMLRRNFSFSRRTRRPPTDPVNAMLSFGYTLLYNEAIGALVAVGFDPYLGFYHSLSYGRCSLALDLIEELRPLTADRLALNLANLEILKPGDFVSQDGRGVYLNGEGRARFLAEYERIMSSEFKNRQTAETTSFRRVLHEQALALQRAINQGAPYKPFQGWH
jgi:CRISPR-associated protein Cas1